MMQMKKKSTFLWCLAGLLLLLSARPEPAAAWDVDLANRASVFFGYDDNVYNANRDLKGDWLGRLFYDFGLKWKINPKNTLTTSYRLGGKVYTREIDEDTLINQLSLDYTTSSIPYLLFGVDGTVKLRNIRDAEEDYLLWDGRTFLGHWFSDQESIHRLYAELHAAYREFDFRGTEYYDYWTQLYGSDLRYHFGRAFSLGLGYDFQRKTYPYNAYHDIGAAGIVLIEADERRIDKLHEIKASSTYLTSFSEALSFRAVGDYVYQYNDSNSYGDSYNNHRIGLNLGLSIYQKSQILFSGIYQARQGTEKVLIPHSYNIEEDNENYNQLAVRFNQEITDYFSLSVNYHRYWSQNENERLNFIKNLYLLGLTFIF